MTRTRNCDGWPSGVGRPARCLSSNVVVHGGGGWGGGGSWVVVVAKRAVQYSDTELEEL